MSSLQHKQKNNISPEVAAELDEIMSQVISKIKPEMEQIILLFKKHNIPGASMELMLGTINSMLNVEPTPAQDLVNGIHKILNYEYGEIKQEIMGMLYDRNHNIAFEIAKILEAARKRDQRSLARELEIIIKKLQ